MASYADNAKAIRNGLANLIATEVAYQEANGPRPDYSIGGRSVSWASWLATMLERLQAAEDRAQSASGPTVVFTRGRA